MSDCEKLSGKVLKTKRNIAYVEVERTDVCSGCKACMLARKSVTTIIATNNIGARTDDMVYVMLAQQKPLIATFILFFIPLIFMTIAILIAYVFAENELILALYAIIGLAIGFVIVAILDKILFSKKYVSRVIEIINTQQGDKL